MKQAGRFTGVKAAKAARIEANVTRRSLIGKSAYRTNCRNKTEKHRSETQQNLGAALYNYGAAAKTCFGA